MSKKARTIVYEVTMSFCPNLGFDDGEDEPEAGRLQEILLEHCVQMIERALDGGYLDSHFDEFRKLEEFTDEEVERQRLRVNQDE